MEYITATQGTCTQQLQSIEMYEKFTDQSNGSEGKPEKKNIQLGCLAIIYMSWERTHS